MTENSVTTAIESIMNNITFEDIGKNSILKTGKIETLDEKKKYKGFKNCRNGTIYGL